MIAYPIFLELQNKINGVSKLTEHLLKTSGSFYIATMKYISELQCFADEHNLYISSDIATALEKLIVFRNKKTEMVTARVNQRKEKDTFAVEVLENLVKLIQDFLLKDRKIFEEGENIWRQILARMLCKSIAEDLPQDNEDKLDCIIAMARSDQELLPYYSHILGLVGMINARVILDITMPQLEL